MGKKKSNIVRTSISVPRELKRRMDKVKEDVNWSALACQAFQEKLAEIAARKEVKAMADVVERLRASKRKSDNEEYQAGHKEGREWAEGHAEAAELERLKALRDQYEREPTYNWEWFFSGEGQSQFSVGQTLYFAINPVAEEDRDYSAAGEFWESVASTDDPDSEFVRGFADGAIDLWIEVQDQL